MRSVSVDGINALYLLILIKDKLFKIIRTDGYNEVLILPIE